MKRHTLTVRACAVILGMAAVCGSLAGAAERAPAAPAVYSAAQLYNLGNSYARSGAPALAVLNYERARVLSPMDADIRANLRHVREAAGLPAQDDLWLAEHGRFANPNTLYWLGLLGLVLAGSAWLLRRPGSTHRAALAAAVIAGLGMTALSLADAAATVSTLNASVVMRTVSATASPVTGAEPLFAVPAAQVVRELAEHQGYVLIRDSQGRDGWIAAGDLTSIIPRRSVSGGGPGP